MQLKIRHTLSEELALPLSYHHIIQSIIYRGLADESGYSRHMHNSGYAANNVNNVGRRYKLFNFSLLRGNSRVMNRQIIFRDYVEWEIRSPDIYMMRLLESAFRKNGIHYGNQHFSDVALRLMNETVEKDRIHIRMQEGSLRRGGSAPDSHSRGGRQSVLSHPADSIRHCRPIPSTLIKAS